MELNELLVQLIPYVISGLAALVAAIAGWLGRKFGKYIDSKQNSEQIRKIIADTVRYVEQIGKHLEAEEKFELAKARAIEWAHTKGIPVSEIEIEILIESFVNEFHASYEFRHDNEHLDFVGPEGTE